MTFLAACKLCGSEQIRQKYVLPHYGLTVFACADCSLKFVGDDLPDEEIDRLYGQPSLATYFLGLGARHEHKFAPRIEELLAMGVPAGTRVVDVGCGSGEFSAMAAAAGYDAVGIDVSAPSIDAARQLHPGVDFRRCDAEELSRVEPEGAGVITLWDVIEHVQRPHEVVEACARALRRGGLIAIGTPNGDSIFDRAADVLYRLVPPVGRWMLDQRYSMWHLQIWTARTLTRLLADHGFEPVRVRRHRELTGAPSLYLRQSHFRNLGAVAGRIDSLLEAVWPVRNKLTVYARRA